MASGGSAISHGGGVADRYATALYSLADDARDVDGTVREMERLGALIAASADFRRLLADPLVDIKQGIAAVRAVLGEEGFSERTVRFVCVVAGNRRLKILPAILRAFAALVAEKRGLVTAEVASAHALSDVQRESLRARLIEAGYGHVNMEERVDPALLGGLVVRIGSRLFDSSIKSQLQRMKFAMGAA